jgi:hypothetical protein
MFQGLHTVACQIVVKCLLYVADKAPVLRQSMASSSGEKRSFDSPY